MTSRKHLLTSNSENGEIRDWYEIIDFYYLSIKSYNVGICDHQLDKMIIIDIQNAQFYEKWV